MFSKISSVVAIAAGLIAPAVAAPGAGYGYQPTCPSTEQFATFEDVSGLPGNALNPIPDPYMGLYYQAFTDVTVIKTGLLPGVVPHGDNYAAAGLVSELLQGTPMLTTNYDGSKAKSFSLESFYYGCALNLANGATAVPTECNVSFTAYKGSDNTVSSSEEVCSQTFSYNPSTSLGEQQVTSSGTVNECFKDVQFITVQFNLPGGLSVANPDLGFVIDDIKYSTKEC